MSPHVNRAMLRAWAATEQRKQQVDAETTSKQADAETKQQMIQSAADIDDIVESATTLYMISMGIPS